MNTGAHFAVEVFAFTLVAVAVYVPILFAVLRFMDRRDGYTLYFTLSYFIGDRATEWLYRGERNEP